MSQKVFLSEENEELSLGVLSLPALSITPALTSKGLTLQCPLPAIPEQSVLCLWQDPDFTSVFKTLFTGEVKTPRAEPGAGRGLGGGEHLHPNPMKTYSPVGTCL